MKSLLGLRGVSLHYSQLRLLELINRRFRLFNPFLQFYNGPAIRRSEAYIMKDKVRNQGES